MSFQIQKPVSWTLYEVPGLVKRFLPLTILWLSRYVIQIGCIFSSSRPSETSRGPVQSRTESSLLQVKLAEVGDHLYPTNLPQCISLLFGHTRDLHNSYARTRCNSLTVHADHISKSWPGRAWELPPQGPGPSLLPPPQLPLRVRVGQRSCLIWVYTVCKRCKKPLPWSKGFRWHLGFYSKKTC